jgi:transcriptional regulator with XRE-family HTH domain
MDEGRILPDARGTLPKRSKPPERPERRRTPPAIGQRLRQFRESAQMTQESVARRAHLTSKFVSQIENGHANPSIDVVARLVENGLGVPLSAFFAADEPTELRDDLAKLESLFAAQTPVVRRRALRVLKALCEE